MLRRIRPLPILIIVLAAAATLLLPLACSGYDVPDSVCSKRGGLSVDGENAPVNSSGNFNISFGQRNGETPAESKAPFPGVEGTVALAGTATLLVLGTVAATSGRREMLWRRPASPIPAG